MILNESDERVTVLTYMALYFNKRIMYAFAWSISDAIFFNVLFFIINFHDCI